MRPRRPQRSGRSFHANSAASVELVTATEGESQGARSCGPSVFAGARALWAEAQARVGDAGRYPDERLLGERSFGRANAVNAIGPVGS